MRPLLLILLILVSRAEAENRPLLPEGLVEQRPATQAGSSAGEVAKLRLKLQELETTLEKLDAEMEVFKAQTGLLIGRSQLSFKNATYGKGGFAILFPRTNTYDFKIFGYGIGLFAGVGQYIGRNHVIDLELVSDMILAVTLRYRFEIHLTSPNVTFGPVIGYRVKVGKTFVDDSYVEKPDEIRKSFVLAGFLFGIPVGKSLINIELDYFTNKQASIVANASLHFFF